MHEASGGANEVFGGDAGNKCRCHWILPVPARFPVGDAAARIFGYYCRGGRGSSTGQSARDGVGLGVGVGGEVGVGVGVGGGRNIIGSAVGRNGGLSHDLELGEYAEVPSGSSVGMHPDGYAEGVQSKRLASVMNDDRLSDDGSEGGFR